jgi:ABC-type transporter Mla MlaB component
VLRINRTENEAALTLKLEGKLLKPWVAEVLRSIGEPQDHPKLQLDLSNVSFVDAAGVELLEGLLARGAEIVACSSFVREMLNLEVP